MKTILLVTLLLCSLTSLAQVATYNFTGAAGDQASQPVSSNDANLTASDIIRGSGITAMTGSGSINAKGWTSTSQDATDYYEFTLTPTTGHQLNLTSINLSVQRSNTGPINFVVAYSIGGGADVTATSGTVSTALADQSVSATFSIKTPLAVRFRVYAWGASNAAGTFRLDNTLTVGGAAPLPVNLLSFSGQSANSAVVLNWATAWEEQNEGFDILKGRNATGLEKIGVIEGHATTQEVASYSFTDTDVQEGQLYYYQLKQRDIGGSSELSNMIAVRVKADSVELQATVYPNPNQGSFILLAPELDESAISLYNSFGTQIPVTASKNQGSNTLSIQANNSIPTGMYYLRFQATNGPHKQAIKVIVQ